MGGERKAGSNCVRELKKRKKSRSASGFAREKAEPLAFLRFVSHREKLLRQLVFLCLRVGVSERDERKLPCSLYLDNFIACPDRYLIWRRHSASPVSAYASGTQETGAGTCLG